MPTYIHGVYPGECLFDHHIDSMTYFQCAGERPLYTCLQCAHRLKRELGRPGYTYLDEGACLLSFINSWGRV